MTQATATPADLDALERDAQARIEQLREQRQHLALDALGNAVARTKLAKVEAEVGDAETALQRLGLARAEQERRAAEARQVELDERQAAAFGEAQQLQAERERVTKAVDETAGEFVAAMTAYVEVCRKQQQRLRAAGRPDAAHVARPAGYQVEAALAFALRDPWWAGAFKIGDGFTRLDQVALISPQHVRPLAESDARPVQKAAKGRR